MSQTPIQPELAPTGLAPDAVSSDSAAGSPPSREDADPKAPAKSVGLSAAQRQALLGALDGITAADGAGKAVPAAAPTPAADATSPTVKTVPRTRITTLNTKTQEKKDTYLGPNLFNILMWLLNWQDDHKADANDYVLSTSNPPGICKTETPMTISALIAEYQSAVVTFSGIKERLTDVTNELMQTSTLASIGLNIVFIHPQQGPIGLTMMSSNAFIDNADIIRGCEDIMVQSMANTLQQHVQRKRAQKKKGDLILPDAKKIIVPGRN